MSTPLTDGINALTAYANEITGAGDSTLSEAIATLASKYAGGNSGTITYPTIDGKPLTASINALIAYSNQVTGESDSTLSDAVATLAAGYSDWDLEWNYADGLPENCGLTKTVSGSPTTYSLTNSGLKITINSNAYILYTFPVTTVTTGVMEVTALFSGCGSYENLRMILSNGTNGAAILTPGNKIRIYDNNQSYGNCTQACTYENNVDVKLKIVLKGSAFDIYKDDVLLSENVSTNVYYATSNRVFVQNLRGGTIYLKSIKIKYNRL